MQQANNQLLNCISQIKNKSGISNRSDDGFSEFYLQDELIQQIKTSYEESTFKNYHRFFQQFYILSTNNQHQVLKTGKVRKQSQVVYSYPNLDQQYKNLNKLLPIFVHPNQVFLQLTNKAKQKSTIKSRGYQKFVLLLQDNERQSIKGIQKKYNQIGKLFVICLNGKIQKKSENISFYSELCLCFVSRFPFINFFLQICQNIRKQGQKSHHPILEQIYFYKQNIEPQHYLMFKDKHQYLLHINKLTMVNQYIENWCDYPKFKKFRISSFFKVIQIVLAQFSIAFHSEYTENLSKYILLVLSLIQPFRWVHPLVVVLPESLQSLDQAPFPVIYGYKCYWNRCGGVEGKFTNKCSFKKNIITYDIDNDTFSNVNKINFDKIKNQTIEDIRDWTATLAKIALGKLEGSPKLATSLQRLKKTQMYIELNRMKNSIVFN